MFGLRNTTKQIHGGIEYYHLQDWWLKTFSEKERDRIQSKYGSITIAKNFSSSQSASGFLWVLSSWLTQFEDRPLAIKILQKAYEEAKKVHSFIDLHLTLGLLVENYYRLRDDEPTAFANAVKSCEEQIALAPESAKAFLKKYPNQSLPSHQGYNQLRIILEKQGEYTKAIALCEQAKKQGWMNDWDKQIETLKKKQYKSSK